MRILISDDVAARQKKFRSYKNFDQLLRLVVYFISKW
jgi:hypothetical protein